MDGCLATVPLKASLLEGRQEGEGRVWVFMIDEQVSSGFTVHSYSISLRPCLLSSLYSLYPNSTPNGYHSPNTPRPPLPSLLSSLLPNHQLYNAPPLSKPQNISFPEPNSGAFDQLSISHDYPTRRRNLFHLLILHPLIIPCLILILIINHQGLILFIIAVRRIKQRGIKSKRDERERG